MRRISKDITKHYQIACSSMSYTPFSFYPKSVIVYSNIFYTFAFVNDIKKWNKAVRSFVVKTVSNV